MAGRRPFLIGLTGPIGCGKSTVARWLEEAGGVRIDADELARQVTAPGQPAVEAILGRFGPEIVGPDGVVNRSSLAAIVFSDPAALRDLEAIVHPAVRARIDRLLADAALAGIPFVVLEAIKLVEGGLAARCDEVWLVECSPDVQRERLLARGEDPSDAERRIATQGDLAERLRPRVTRVISTNGTRHSVRRRVAAEIQAALRGRVAS